MLNKYNITDTINNLSALKKAPLTTINSFNKDEAHKYVSTLVQIYGDKYKKNDITYISDIKRTLAEKKSFIKNSLGLTKSPDGKDFLPGVLGKDVNESHKLIDETISKLKEETKKVNIDDEQSRLINKLDERTLAIEKLRTQLFANQSINTKLVDGKLIEDIEGNYFKADKPDRINSKIGTNMMGLSRRLKTSEYTPEEYQKSKYQKRKNISVRVNIKK